jgi:hypothetical protein
MQPGTYQYTIVASYGSFGPYDLTIAPNLEGNNGELQINNNGFGGATSGMNWLPSINTLNNPNGAFIGQVFSASHSFSAGPGANFGSVFSKLGTISVGQVGCLQSGGAIQLCPTNSPFWTGITYAVASSQVEIATSGQVICTFDNTSVVGDYVQLSQTTSGSCHDSGTIPTNVFIGTVIGSGGLVYLSSGGASGGSTPGGNTTQVQYNLGGFFAADSGFTYNRSTGQVNIGGAIAPGTPTFTFGPHAAIPTSWTFDTYSPSTAFSSLNPTSGLIAWPGTCTSGSQVYAPSINSCVAVGTAGNPAPAASTFQYNNGGVFGAVTGTAADTSGNVKQLGNFCYAVGNQSPVGSGNNGMANCAAAGVTTIIDKSYPGTELYAYATPNNHVMSPSQTQSFDYRWGGQFTQYSHNPVGGGYINSLYHIPFQQVVQNDVIQNHPVGGYAASTVHRAFEQDIYYSMPGLDVGNPGLGQGGWTQMGGHVLNMTINSPGLMVGIYSGVTKAGIGDNQFLEASGAYYGGAVAPSDEGNHVLRSIAGTATTQYAGTIATGGVGATTVTVNCSADCPNPGDGRFLIFKGTPILSNANVTSMTNPTSSSPGTYTIDQSVTPSTAWASITNNTGNTCAPTISAPVGIAGTPTVCNVTMISGTFNVGDHVCFSSNFHEQSVITAVGAGTITLPLRQAHGAGAASWVMANGPCGDFIDETANDFSGLNFPYEIIGATGANTLVWQWFGTGGAPSTTFQHGQFYPQQFNALTLTNQGGIVTVVIAGGVVSFNPQLYDGTSVAFSGPNAGAFAGVCTNTFHDPVSTTTFRCSQSSSIGAAVASNVTVAYGTSGYGTTGFNLYAGAQTLDVNTPGTSSGCGPSSSNPCPPAVSPGNITTFTLEPNNAAWTPGQAVIQPMHYQWRGSQFRSIYNYYNPLINNSPVYLITLAGSPSSATPAIQIGNSGSNSLYEGYGGLLFPPSGLYFSGGLWSIFLNSVTAPTYGGSVISIGCPVSGCITFDPLYTYTWFNVSNGSNSVTGMTFKPYANELTIQPNVVFSLPLAKQTFTDNPTALAIAIPAAPSVTVSNIGGTMLAGSLNCYTQVVQNNAGTTMPGAEKCAGLPYSLTLTSVAAASGGSTVYTGTITGGGSNALAGETFKIYGFTASSGANNGTFLCTASTTTTLTLSNASGVVETATGTAVPSTLAVTSVANTSGGSTVYTGVFANGASNALAGGKMTVAGFTNGGNNGTFIVTASTTTTLTMTNAGGIAETATATAAGASYSARVQWGRPQGAYLYRICGRTSGAEGQVYQSGFNSSETLFWIDDGTAAVGANCAGTYTSNTTLPGMDQWQYFGANSSGTAFQTKIQAAAGNAGNTTLTLPSLTGSIPVVVARGTAVMTTASITAGLCGTTVSATATNVLATDTISYSFNNAPVGTNAGIVTWPGAGSVNFAYCPGVAETPAAATINWTVVR